MDIVITAGGTSEPIDSVRKITNMSTGKLGAEICNVLLDKCKNEKLNHKIIYICNKYSVRPVDKNNRQLEIIETTNTDSVLKAVQKILTTKKIDHFIHAMAISDYSVDKVVSPEEMIEKILSENMNQEEIIELIKDPISIDNNSKISSVHEALDIRLRKTPKIINMIKEISKNTHLIGFKLLNNVSEEELISVASKSLIKTNSDYIIANDLIHIKKGNHRALIISRKEEPVIVEGKGRIAIEIVNLLGEL